MAGIDAAAEAAAAGMIGFFLLFYVVFSSTIGLTGICLSLWSRYPIGGLILGLGGASAGLLSTVANWEHFGPRPVVDALVVTPLFIGVASIYLGVNRMERTRLKKQD